MSFSTLRNNNLQWSGSSRKGPGDSEIQPWDMLCSRISQYKLQRFRFSGCFSKIAECKDIETKEIMAIKILKRKANESQESNRELAMLKRIRSLDPVNIVRFFEGFEHKGHICLVFEILHKNLHDVLKERRGNQLSLQEIKPITQQLLSALKSLKTVGVIHTNITPHNIMLVNHNDQPFRVKLIDFGSAIAAAEVERGVIMQSVGYRSPDVILGLPLSEAVDMWSLGGVLATMYLGSLPFPQRCQYYLMKTIVETLGQPEDKLLRDGTNTLLYFSQNQNSTKPAWRLKTADEYKAVTGFPPQIHRGSSVRLSCLDDLVMFYPEVDKQIDKMTFVSLLTMMLHLNHQKRITPSEALIHPFLTLCEPDDDDDDTISQEMVSITPMSLSPVMESAEEVNFCITSIHTDQEPNNDGVSSSAIVISVDGASAATESSNKDSATRCSGVKNLPAVFLNEDTSDDAAVLADGPTASSDEEVTTGMKDTVCDKVSGSTAGLADDTGDEALSKSVRAESKDAATGSAEASTMPVTAGLYDAASADEATVNTSSTCEDTGSRNTRRMQLIRTFLRRMLKVLCCCFSVDVME